MWAVRAGEGWRRGEGEGEGLVGNSEEEAESEPRKRETARVHLQVVVDQDVKTRAVEWAVAGKRSYQWKRCRSS